MIRALLKLPRVLFSVAGIEWAAERELLQCQLRFVGAPPNTTASNEALRAELELRMRGYEPKQGATAEELREQLFLEESLERLSAKRKEQAG